MRAIFTNPVLDYISSDEYQTFLKTQKRFARMLEKAAVLYVKEVKGFDILYLVKRAGPGYAKYIVDVPAGVDLDGKVTVRYLYVSDYGVRGPERGYQTQEMWQVPVRELVERYSPQGR